MSKPIDPCRDKHSTANRRSCGGVLYIVAARNSPLTGTSNFEFPVTYPQCGNVSFSQGFPGCLENLLVFEAFGFVPSLSWEKVRVGHSSTTFFGVPYGKRSEKNSTLSILVSVLATRHLSSPQVYFGVKGMVTPSGFAKPNYSRSVNGSLHLEYCFRKRRERSLTLSAFSKSNKKRL